MSTSQSADTACAPPPGSPRGSVRRVMAHGDFRLLFAGTSTSRLGDQFALIATPWLLLEITDDPLALGIVLALEGLPRAAFILVGGAATDRYSPRGVVIAADAARGILTAVMAVAALTGAVEPWMLYVFALTFGLCSGMALPAENSLAPALVPHDDLHAANATLMGVTQFAGFVGPSLAGVVIAMAAQSMTGIGWAFGIDAVTFAVSAAALWLVRARPATAVDSPAETLWGSIREGVAGVRADEPLRLVFTMLLTLNLFVLGPLLVGIPVLAHERLAEGVAAFGTLMGAFALGNLAGFVVAGSARHPSSGVMRAIVLGLFGGFGVTIVSLAIAAHLWIDAGLLVVLGLGNGYLAVHVVTWVQARTPARLLGRTTALVTFASLGLVSISQAAAGTVARWNLDALFVGSGALVLTATAWTATRPALRAVTDSLATRSNHDR